MYVMQVRQEQRILCVHVYVRMCVCVCACVACLVYNTLKYLGEMVLLGGYHIL